MKNIKSYLNICWNIIKVDLTIFKNLIIAEYIDILFWLTSIIAIFTYVLPRMGIVNTYGQFITIGLIVGGPFWGIWSNSIRFISDMDGNKEITYFLTLPIPNWLVLITQTISLSIQSIIKAAIILPIGKLVLMNNMNLSNISIWKYIIAFVIMNLFCNSMSLFIVSIVKSMNHIERIGIRILFPIWSLGCSQFPWRILNELSTWFGYLALANPLTYAMEAMHSAIEGQKGYLNFNLCLLVMVISIVVFSFIGVMRLKKRLDFV